MPCIRDDILLRKKPPTRSHTPSEFFSASAGIALVSLAARHAGAREITSASVFAVTLGVMYLASTLYHAIPHPRAKRGMKVFVHCAIFLLIAGTYTPFTIAALKATLGWCCSGSSGD